MASASGRTAACWESSWASADEDEQEDSEEEEDDEDDWWLEDLMELLEPEQATRLDPVRPSQTHPGVTGALLGLASAGVGGGAGGQVLGQGGGQRR